MLKTAGKKSLERSFPNIEPGVAEAIAAAFPESVHVNIDSEEAFKSLLNEIKSAPKPFIGKVYQISFPETMSEEYHFDLMIAQIEELISARTHKKHLSAFVGTEPVTQRRNLAAGIEMLKPKVDTLFLEQTVKQSANLRTAYLTPTVIFGVALGIILTFGMIYAALQLFDIQTPSSFVDKGINWGKIEM